MKTKAIFIPFVAAGMMLLIVSGYLALRTGNFLRIASAANGVVVSWQRTSGRNSTHYPRVRFRTETGQVVTFVSHIAERPPSYEPGDRVRVLYDPADPQTAHIDSFVQLWLLPFIFGTLGLIFTSVGGIPLLWMRHVRIRDEWLMANGQQIVAELHAIELNSNIRVNRRSPWRLVCHWQDPSDRRLYVFHSHNLWNDPRPYIKGKQVLILADPRNLSRYMVDTSFLPAEKP